MTYTVSARGVCKSFGAHVALDSIDLDIETGTVFGLLGPNGAGKTTLVRILSTLVAPDAGSVVVAGHDLLTDPVGVRRSISLTGQFAAIDDVLTGRENLTMLAELRHLPRASIGARVAELLAEFDLADAADRRASTYSGGMRRRLDLAISMIERPQLLVLDEPTTGLDPLSREQLWAKVAAIVDEGVTVLLTTQYLEEADQVAHRIGLLARGQIVASGPPDQLKARLGGEIVRLQFADAGDCRRAAGLLDVHCANLRLNLLDVATDGTAAEVGHLLGRLAEAGTPAQRVSTKRPTLDDVFREFTRPAAQHTAIKELTR